MFATTTLPGLVPRQLPLHNKSRQIVFRGVRAVLPRPHSNKETDKDAVEDYLAFCKKLGDEADDKLAA